MRADVQEELVVEYKPPAGFTRNTAIEPEYAEQGRIIYPIRQPLQRTQDWFMAPVFTPKDVQRVVSMFGPVGENKPPNYPSRQQLWPTKASGWVYERIATHFLWCNESLHLSLSGFVEPVSLLTYRPGDELTWHADYSGWERVKLAMVMAVNDPEDYQGGELDFILPAERGQMPPKYLMSGEAVFYPGWVPHRVTPVMGGVRRIILAFAYGPRYT